MLEKFEIKLATIEDMKSVFDLSNDELVRANSFNQEKIIWDDHQKWFEKKINDENSVFYIVNNLNNIFMGYVRLEKEKEDWILTIHLRGEYRGKGLGKEILETICSLNSEKCIIAFVKEKNLPSVNSFEKANFENINLVSINNERYYKLKHERNSN